MSKRRLESTDARRAKSVLENVRDSVLAVDNSIMVDGQVKALEDKASGIVSSFNSHPEFPESDSTVPHYDELHSPMESDVFMHGLEEFKSCDKVNTYPLTFIERFMLRFGYVKVERAQRFLKNLHWLF